MLLVLLSAAAFAQSGGVNPDNQAEPQGTSSIAYAAAGFSVNTCLKEGDPGCTNIGVGWTGSYSTLAPWFNPYQEGEGRHAVMEYGVTGAQDLNVCPDLTSTVGSPIVIDLDGGDFNDAFTDVAHGVVWDFFGIGNMTRMSWTNPKRNIGFLALDRNKNGLVDSAKELFGDITNQPLTPQESLDYIQQRADDDTTGRPHQHFHPNGFRALAFFDQPSHGGNGDGHLDKNDSIWPSLRVCVDTKQDAHLVIANCKTLDELGITAISLKYVPGARVDQYGNQMRYEGSLTIGKTVATMPKIYDVFFKTVTQ